MQTTDRKFLDISIDFAPGQEANLTNAATPEIRGGNLPGVPVDFSHGDIDAFKPAPGAFEAFSRGVAEGGVQGYTVYRGREEIRTELAAKLGKFTGAPVDPQRELIITPGTQGALFIAMMTSLSAGDKIAIVEPDYFANRNIANFLGLEILPVRLDYLNNSDQAGLDLSQLEDAFKRGAKVFVFSNPNNPVGAIYSEAEIRSIARLADAHGVTLIVDELYSRLIYDNRQYTHMRASDVYPGKTITLLGPSKTESLSGYRVGVAMGPETAINRMEKLQALACLRTAGYSQSVLRTWFSEPKGWMAERVALHQAIRDDLIKEFRAMPGVAVRCTEAGSYVFPRLPQLVIPIKTFARFARQQAGVTVTPGTEFSPNATDSVRLNFSQDHRAAVEGVKRLGILLQRYAK